MELFFLYFVEFINVFVIFERYEQETGVFLEENQRKKIRREYSVSKNQLKNGVDDFPHRRKQFNPFPRTENRFDDNKTSQFISQSG